MRYVLYISAKLDRDEVSRLIVYRYVCFGAKTLDKYTGIRKIERLDRQGFERCLGKEKTPVTCKDKWDRRARKNIDEILDKCFAVVEPGRDVQIIDHHKCSCV